MNAPRRLAPLIALPVLHVVAALAGLTVAALDPSVAVPSPHPFWVHVGQILVFAGVGTWLLSAGRQDARAVLLAGSFLVIAAGYAIRPIEVFFPGPFGEPARLLHATSPDAFLPLFLWLFFREFPRGLDSRRAGVLVRSAIRASAIAGLVLVAVNLCLLAAPERAEGEIWRHLSAFDRGRRDGGYWLVVFGLSAPAFAFGLWRTRRARAEERRRVSVFVAGCVAGAAPTFAYQALLTLGAPEAPLDRWLLPLAQLGLLSIPVITAYSVLVDQVLDVRLLLRIALRYTLARTTAWALMVLPFVLFGVYLVQVRDATVAELFTPGRVVLFGAVVAVGLAVLSLREQAFDTIDRRFFREHYDARRILSALVSRVREARSPAELAELVAWGIDDALHLDRVCVLLDGAGGDFRPIAGAASPLPASAALARRLAEAQAPLDLDLEDARSSLRLLPLEERRWIADGGFRLLVPMRGTDRPVLGTIALGAKRSELPFSGEDRDLLSTIAASGAVCLENQRMRSATPATPPAEQQNALECIVCGRVHGPDAARCDECGGALEPAPVPLLLFGKFRFERRLGAGAMGVVYRASDLVLARPVAAKTLPRLTPEDAMRLRREARAAATIVHPHLAAIFGVETWRDRPIIVSELLEGGTLAERIATGPLDLPEVLQLGRVLADALDRIHGAGILHGDVKPSNIGLTSDGVPKLLDFGLARALGTSASEQRGVVEGDEAASASVVVGASAAGGTPLYMPPESVAGRPAELSFDLWAAALVLYEAASGSHPLERESWAETNYAIARADIPDLRARLPACGEGLAAFFRDALARDPSRRPNTARDLRRRLDAVSA